MKTVICIHEGLQEYEGNTYVLVWGKGEGETLREVCEDIIKRDPGMGKYFKAHPDGSCSDWGFRLQLLD